MSHLYELHHGRCQDVLRRYPDNYFDAVVTDPPYGLGKINNVEGLLNAWLNGKDGRDCHGSVGFMSNAWDAAVPSPSVWQEVLRTLKPGAHLVCFAGSRTHDRMGVKGLRGVQILFNIIS